jgi:hypothetical protein
MTVAVGLNWGNEAARFAELSSGADLIKTRRFIPLVLSPCIVILSASEGSPTNILIKSYFTENL